MELVSGDTGPDGVLSDSTVPGCLKTEEQENQGVTTLTAVIRIVGTGLLALC